MVGLRLGVIVASLVYGLEARECRSFRSSARVLTPWASLFDVVSTDDFVGTEPETVGLYRIGVQPLLEASGYAYGTSESTDVVLGHRLVAALRPEVGVNALAYVYNETSDATFLIFSFRGTISASDNCANEVFFVGERSEACIAAFSEDEIDYVSQADAFVQSTIESLQLRKWSSVRVLFTGHSLGAAMAGYMSTFYQNRKNRGYMCRFDFRATAFAFGSPGYKSIIEVEDDREITRVGCHVHVYHPYDPIVIPRLDNQLGRQCGYSTDETPLTESCEACFAGNSSECGQCGDEAHNLRAYIALTFAPNTTIPVCI